MCLSYGDTKCVFLMGTRNVISSGDICVKCMYLMGTFV